MRSSRLSAPAQLPRVIRSIATAEQRLRSLITIRIVVRQCQHHLRERDFITDAQDQQARPESARHPPAGAWGDSSSTFRVASDGDIRVLRSGPLFAPE